MKTLIINGSPRKDGDTVSLINELKRHLTGEIVELSAYYDKIMPCIDCRACKTTKGCAIKDDMQIIYNDDFDNVVIASPIYMSNLTGPLVSLASRFQAYYSAKRFLKDRFCLRKKKAVLILVGGGDGSPNDALRLSAGLFQWMNAHGFEEHTILSLKTDDIQAMDDNIAIENIRIAADYLNINQSA